VGTQDLTIGGKEGYLERWILEARGGEGAHGKKGPLATKSGGWGRREGGGEQFWGRSGVSEKNVARRANSGKKKTYCRRGGKYLEGGERGPRGGGGGYRSQLQYFMPLASGRI